MNCIEELLELYKGKRIWFDLHDKEAREHFRKNILELNVHWSDGSKFKEYQNISGFMSVHEDKVLTFVSGFIWAYSFSQEPLVSNGKKVVKIDFKKYIERKEDYLINKLNISYNMQDK